MPARKRAPAKRRPATESRHPLMKPVGRAETAAIARLRAICLALPGAIEKIAWGEADVARAARSSRRWIPTITAPTISRSGSPPARASRRRSSRRTPRGSSGRRPRGAEGLGRRPPRSQARLAHHCRARDRRVSREWRRPACSRSSTRPAARRTAVGAPALARRQPRTPKRSARVLHAPGLIARRFPRGRRGGFSSSRVAAPQILSRPSSSGRMKLRADEGRMAASMP